MQFVLTNYGATLFAATGIPQSLNFVAGSAFGYTPGNQETAIHGSIVANGTASLVSNSTAQPVYGLTISNVDFPNAVAFGEVGLFFNGVLVAMGTVTSSLSLQGKNVSVECVLPTVAGALGVFSPVSLAANAGNINVLPSVDVLPNANTATTYTRATGISNSYVIAESGLLAVSTGVHWDLVGGLFLDTLTVDSSDFTSIYIQQGSSADVKLSQIEVPTTMYLTVTSGINTGLARKVTFSGLVRHAYTNGLVTSYKFTTVAPWSNLFQHNDTVNAYMAIPAVVKVSQGGAGPAGPPGLDSFVPGPTGPTGPAGTALLDGIFVLDVTPTGSGIVGNKIHPLTVPSNRVISSCTTDNSHVRVTVGVNGNSLSYSPTVTIAGVNAIVTESTTTRWFTAYADIILGAGTTIVEVLSNTGAKASVSVTLAGAGPSILSAVLGPYPNGQTALKAGDQITVTVTTAPGATEVQLLAQGASSVSPPGFTVTGTTAVCVVTIGSASGSQALTFKAKNTLGTYGATFATAALVLDQVVPSFGALTLGYPASQGALTGTDTAIVNCAVSNQTSVTYTATGLTVASPAVYATNKVVTLASTGYVDSGTNYTITAFKSTNGSSATKTGLVNIATTAPTASITTSPAGRMVGSPTGINYTVTVTSTQNLNAAPSLTASAGAWAGGWSGSGKVWTRSLAISDATPKGTSLFSALSLVNQSLIPGSVISSGSTYIVGGISSRTLTFPAFSRVTPIGAVVLDQAKTSCQVVAGNILTRYTDNTVRSSGYYIANADGTFNSQGAYVALSDSAFSGANTSGTLQVTFIEAA